MLALQQATRSTAATWHPAAAPNAISRAPKQRGSAAQAPGAPCRCRRRPAPTFAAASAAGEGSVLGSAASTAPTPASTGRKFVFAVDGKPECEQALLWASANLFSKGG